MSNYPTAVIILTYRYDASALQVPEWTSDNVSVISIILHAHSRGGSTVGGIALRNETMRPRFCVSYHQRRSIRRITLLRYVRLMWSYKIIHLSSVCKPFVQRVKLFGIIFCTVKAKGLRQCLLKVWKEIHRVVVQV